VKLKQIKTLTFLAVSFVFVTLISPSTIKLKLCSLKTIWPRKNILADVSLSFLSIRPLSASLDEVLISFEMLTFQIIATLCLRSF